jgi:23S rRNA pseudouridine2604 synthase
MTEAVRLAKRVAAQLACSRSQAEHYIEGGWVRVNGQVVEEPHFRVHDHDQVAIDDNANLMALTPVTLLLHKPADEAAPLHLLSSAGHWAQDPAEMAVLKRHFLKLTPCMSLETAASGLVVFTQDFRVARKLTQDAHLLEIELTVEVAGEVSPAQLQRLMRADESQPGLQVKASVNSSNAQVSKLRLAIKGGHLGLAASLCDAAGLHIQSMKRIRIGRVPMTQLPVGQWRYLMPHELF